MFRNGLHTFGTNLLQVAAALLITAVIARWLGPAGKGAYDLYVTTAQLLATFTGLSLPSGIAYAVACRKADPGRLKRVAIVLSILQSGLCLAVLALLCRMHLIDRIVPAAMGTAGLLAVAVNVGLLAASGCLRAVLSGLQQFVQANHGDLVKQAAAVAFLAVAVGLRHTKLTTLILLCVVANMCAIGTAIWSYQRHIPAPAAPGDAGGEFRFCLKYSLPSYAANVVQFVNYRLSVYYIHAWLGAAVLGVYYTATLLSQTLWLLPGALASVIFPTVANAASAGANESRRTAQCARLALWVSAVCGLVLAVLAPFSVPMFFGASFHPAAAVILWLLPGTVAFCPAQVIAGHIAGVGRPEWNFAGSLSGAVVTIVLALASRAAMGNGRCSHRDEAPRV